MELPSLLWVPPGRSMLSARWSILRPAALERINLIVSESARTVAMVDGKVNDDS